MAIPTNRRRIAIPTNRNSIGSRALIVAIGNRALLFAIVALAALAISPGHAQNWEQDDQIFNPSGIPSLPFSQPRFADLDGDGDFDMLLGSTECSLLYYQNIGTATAPRLAAGPEIFAPVDPLDAELGVCIDLDGDGDLDLVAGGYNGLTLFENTGSASEPVFIESPGFFSGLVIGTNPVPTFADLDGDLDFDLLVGLSESGALKFYPNTGTTAAAEFTEAESEIWFDIGLYAYPWLADLDGDADVDLSAGRDTPGFVYYRNDGDPYAWNWQLDETFFDALAQSTYWNSPCLVNLNGAGQPDLIYGTAAGPLQYYENSGPPADPVWTANTTLFGGVLDVGAASSPFFFDFDLDGDLDLVSGSQLGDIKYYANVGSATAPAWQAAHEYFASIDHSIYSAITLGDLDDDDLADAVVGDLSGNLFYHHNTGTGFEYDPSIFAGINVGAWSVPRLVDMDGDGDLDLVIGNEAGRLTYYANVGTAQHMAWQQVPGYFGSIDVGSNCVPTLGDYDHDGDNDLLTGDLFNELQYFENVGGSWQEDPSIVAGLVVGQNAAPAFGDLDDDGDLDLAVGNYSGTFNYFVNTNQTADVPSDQRIPRLCVLQARPNPFNPFVTLTYSLAQPANVDLAIYDAQGRSLSQLVHAFQPAGQYAIEWNRSSATRARSGSGVYFCRLRVGDKSQTVVLRSLR